MLNFKKITKFFTITALSLSTFATSFSFNKFENTKSELNSDLVEEKIDNKIKYSKYFTDGNETLYKHKLQITFDNKIVNLKNYKKYKETILLDLKNNLLEVNDYEELFEMFITFNDIGVNIDDFLNKINSYNFVSNITYYSEIGESSNSFAQSSFTPSFKNENYEEELMNHQWLLEDKLEVSNHNLKSNSLKVDNFRNKKILSHKYKNIFYRGFNNFFYLNLLQIESSDIEKFFKNQSFSFVFENTETKELITSEIISHTNFENNILKFEFKKSLPINKTFKLKFIKEMINENTVDVSKTSLDNSYINTIDAVLLKDVSYNNFHELEISIIDTNKILGESFVLGVIIGDDNNDKNFEVFYKNFFNHNLNSSKLINVPIELGNNFTLRSDMKIKSIFLEGINFNKKLFNVHRKDNKLEIFNGSSYELKSKLINNNNNVLEESNINIVKEKYLDEDFKKYRYGFAIIENVDINQDHKQFNKYELANIFNIHFTKADDLKWGVSKEKYGYLSNSEKKEKNHASAVAGILVGPRGLNPEMDLFNINIKNKLTTKKWKNLLKFFINEKITTLNWSGNFDFKKIIRLNAIKKANKDKSFRISDINNYNDEEWEEFVKQSIDDFLREDGELISQINDDLLKYNITLVSAISNLDQSPIVIERGSKVEVINLSNRKIYSLNLFNNAIYVGSATKDPKNKFKIKKSNFSEIEPYNDYFIKNKFDNKNYLDNKPITFADGENHWFYSGYNFNEIEKNEGSSFATPIVSGSISLLKTYLKNKFNKEITTNEIKALILASNDYNKKINKYDSNHFENNELGFFNFLKMFENLKSLSSWDLDDYPNDGVINLGPSKDMEALRITLNPKQESKNISISIQNKAKIKILENEDINKIKLYNRIPKFGIVVSQTMDYPKNYYYLTQKDYILKFETKNDASFNLNLDERDINLTKQTFIFIYFLDLKKHPYSYFLKLEDVDYSNLIITTAHN